jgi:hypothetical protein
VLAQVTPYIPAMADHPDPIAQTPPQAWIDALARADADVAAGRTVSGDGIMHRLRQTLAEMEARQGLPKSDKAIHHQ